MKIEHDRFITFYTILSPTIFDRDNPYPHFSGVEHNGNKVALNKETFKSLKLMPLSNFLDLLRRTGNRNFNKQHVIYFILPDRKKYIRHFVKFDAPGETLINVESTKN